MCLYVLQSGYSATQSKVTLNLKWYYILITNAITPAMWDHTVTATLCCYPTHVNAPLPNPSPQAGTRFTYLRGMEGWVDLGYLAIVESHGLYADDTQVYGSCRPASVYEFSSRISKCVGAVLSCKIVQQVVTELRQNQSPVVRIRWSIPYTSLGLG